MQEGLSEEQWLESFNNTGIGNQDNLVDNDLELGESASVTSGGSRRSRGSVASMRAEAVVKHAEIEAKLKKKKELDNLERERVIMQLEIRQKEERARMEMELVGTSAAVRALDVLDNEDKYNGVGLTTENRNTDIGDKLKGLSLDVEPKDQPSRKLGDFAFVDQSIGPPNGNQSRSLDQDSKFELESSNQDLIRTLI